MDAPVQGRVGYTRVCTRTGRGDVMAVTRPIGHGIDASLDRFRRWMGRLYKAIPRPFRTMGGSPVRRVIAIISDPQGVDPDQV